MSFEKATEMRKQKLTCYRLLFLTPKSCWNEHFQLWPHKIVSSRGTHWSESLQWAEGFKPGLVFLSSILTALCLSLVWVLHWSSGMYCILYVLVMSTVLLFNVCVCHHRPSQGVGTSTGQACIPPTSTRTNYDRNDISRLVFVIRMEIFWCTKFLKYNFVT